MAEEQHPIFEAMREASRAGDHERVDLLLDQLAAFQRDAADAFDRFIDKQRRWRDESIVETNELSGTLEAIRGMSRS